MKEKRGERRGGRRNGPGGETEPFKGHCQPLVLLLASLRIRGKLGVIRLSALWCVPRERRGSRPFMSHVVLQRPRPGENYSKIQSFSSSSSHSRFAASHGAPLYAEAAPAPAALKRGQIYTWRVSSITREWINSVSPKPWTHPSPET